MTIDTSEKGLETLIMRHMTGMDGLSVMPNMVAEPPPHYGGAATGRAGGSGAIRRYDVTGRRGRRGVITISPSPMR